MVLHMEYSFFVGGCLACFMTGVLWDMRAQIEYFLVMLVVALFFYKIVVMCFATDTDDSNASSSRRSTAEQTMAANVQAALHTATAMRTSKIIHFSAPPFNFVNTCSSCSAEVTYRVERKVDKMR
jgi:uncharacterized membrane protein